MGMSYGMMGGLAGIGKGLVEHSDFLRKQEEADLEMGRQTKMQQFLMTAREEYTLKAEARADQREVAREGRTDSRDIAKEGRTRAAKREDDDYAFSKRVERNPQEIEMAKDAERAKIDVQAQAVTTQGNDPEYLRAARNLAQAKHIEGLGSVTQAKLAQMTIDEKVKVNGLIEEFTTTKDPLRKTEIKEALTVRGIIKPGEYDTEKVATKVQNPDGSETETTRTQKRRPDGAAPTAAPQLATGMEVDGFVYMGGNPKDKNSWKPKGRTSGGAVQ